MPTNLTHDTNALHDTRLLCFTLRFDTLPDTSRRCSVQHGSNRHRSLAGLPSPENIAGRVLIAVQHQSAERTNMGAYAETFLHARPTAATVLAGVLRGYCDHRAASIHC